MSHSSPVYLQSESVIVQNVPCIAAHFLETRQIIGFIFASSHQ